jgi:hypothetical protein
MGQTVQSPQLFHGKEVNSRMEGIFTIIWLVSAMNGAYEPMNGPQARQEPHIEALAATGDPDDLAPRDRVPGFAEQALFLGGERPEAVAVDLVEDPVDLRAEVAAIAHVERVDR